jgi:hypothetical protein
MLHAINRRKARINVFRGPGQRVPIEDVITSTVFGPLLFMDPAEAHKVLLLVLDQLRIAPPSWSGTAHLTLWPRKPFDLFRSRYVEPDAEIVDAAGNALVIEVKWGAPLGKHELASQWLSLSPQARAKSRHLLIVNETAPYGDAIREDGALIANTCDLPWRLDAVSWRQLAEAFGAIARNIELNSGTRHWALAMNGFLRRVDPRSVAGWNQLGIEPVTDLRWGFTRLISIPAGLQELRWSFKR